MTEQPTAAAMPTHHSHRDTTTISEYLESLLVTVILALFGTSFVVQAFKIPSPSMEKTLLVGDHLLVNKFVFGGTGAWYEKLLPYRPLERGDIIVFKFPRVQPEWAHDLHNYVRGDEIVVPPGKYFAMGDNRDNSWDCRYWGFVDKRAIKIGRAHV